MSVQLTDMIAYVRDTSGLKSNQIITDAKICTYLSQGKSKLRDIFIDSKQHWFRKSYKFSLTGGVGGNTLDLTLIPDLQMDQYLNRTPLSPNPEIVDRLGSSAERNYSSGVVWPWANRKYDTDGDVLTIYPPNMAQGDYELFYTPFDDPFALPIEGTFNIDASDTNPPGAPVSPGPGCWFFKNAAFNARNPDGSYRPLVTSDGLSYITTHFLAPNTSYNTTWIINGVSATASNEVSVTVSTGASVTGPASGTVDYHFQPYGTRADLPNVLTPWQLYVTTFACIEVRKSRGQDVRDFLDTFVAEDKRAHAMAKMRSEGVRQAPITRRRGWGITRYSP